MIPVMLMGTVLHGKRYSLLEYACCLAISGGRRGCQCSSAMQVGAACRCAKRRCRPAVEGASLRAHIQEQAEHALLPAPALCSRCCCCCCCRCCRCRCSTAQQSGFATGPSQHASPPSACPAAAGVGLFGMKSSSKVTRKLASPNAPLGYSLCLVNLVLDGYTNAAQVGGVVRTGEQ